MSDQSDAAQEEKTSGGQNVKISVNGATGPEINGNSQEGDDASHNIGKDNSAQHSRNDSTDKHHSPPDEDPTMPSNSVEMEASITSDGTEFSKPEASINGVRHELQPKTNHKDDKKDLTDAIDDEHDIKKSKNKHNNTKGHKKKNDSGIAGIVPDDKEDEDKSTVPDSDGSGGTRGPPAGYEVKSLDYFEVGTFFTVKQEGNVFLSDKTWLLISSGPTNGHIVHIREFEEKDIALTTRDNFQINHIRLWNSGEAPNDQACSVETVAGRELQEHAYVKRSGNIGNIGFQSSNLFILNRGCMDAENLNRLKEALKRHFQW